MEILNGGGNDIVLEKTHWKKTTDRQPEWASENLNLEGPKGMK